MREQHWNATGERLPQEGQEVWTMNSAGEVGTLVYLNGLWWFPDRSMYVYYTPQFWKAMA